MTTTNNYQLNQWALSDQVRMADFNADNQKIDAALKVLDSRPKLMTSTYIGTGDYNSTWTLLKFDETLGTSPKVLYISKPGTKYQLFLIHGMTEQTVDPTSTSSSYRVSVVWTDTGVRWLSTNSALYQMNEKGTRYYYFAMA